MRIQPLHGLERMNGFDRIIADFNKMAEELSSIETLRTDFIASVSHEIKTPLAVMQNYATLLQTPNLTAEQRVEYAGAIADAAGRLSDLITNILRLSKLENQNIFPAVASYNLGEQLRECVLALEDLWEQKNLQLDIAIDDVQVEADEELLTLVWNNLLSNAIKFTDNGGTIAVSVIETEQWRWSVSQILAVVSALKWDGAYLKNFIRATAPCNAGQWLRLSAGETHCGYYWRGNIGGKCCWCRQYLYRAVAEMSDKNIGRPFGGAACILAGCG